MRRQALGRKQGVTVIKEATSVKLYSPNLTPQYNQTVGRQLLYLLVLLVAPAALPSCCCCCCLRLAPLPFPGPGAKAPYKVQDKLGDIDKRS